MCFTPLELERIANDWRAVHIGLFLFVCSSAFWIIIFLSKEEKSYKCVDKTK